MKPIFTTTIALIIYSVCYTQVHQLWVTTSLGGTNNIGAFFVADGAGNNFHSVYNCDSTGSWPVGNLAMADNGLLYGVTQRGGFGDSCVIYTYDALTGVFTNIYDFAFVHDSGYGGECGLTLATDGKLYGTTYTGGLNGSGTGVIYTVDPSNNSYQRLYTFNPDSGANPKAGVTQLSDGKLYGTTNLGGLHGAGVIFSFDPGTSAYKVLHHFNDTAEGKPMFGKLLKATNGKLYGLTSSGGLNYSGIIYSFDLNGNIFTRLYDFDAPHGSLPFGGLIQATDGKLYGLTYQGGLYDKGVIFSFNPVTNVYTDLHDFAGIDGAYCGRNVMQATNGKLYGTTTNGGTANAGVVFSYNIVGGTYTKLYDFDGVTGMWPSGEIFESVTPSASTLPVLNTVADFRISPNPCSTSFMLTIPETPMGATATITDMSGRRMMAVPLSTANCQLSTANFPNGIYFVIVSNCAQSATKKLVVNR